MKIREVKCDHAIENPKEHPALEYINIGNLIIGVCITCYNALKGQILEDSLKPFFTGPTMLPLITEEKKQP